MKKHRVFSATFALLAWLLAGQSLITPAQAAPATFTDSGSTLVIALGAGEQLTIISNGTTYTSDWLTNLIWINR